MTALEVLVGPFCRKGLSPQGEPWRDVNLPNSAPIMGECIEELSRRGREGLLGKQDLPYAAL